MSSALTSQLWPLMRRRCFPATRFTLVVAGAVFSLSGCRGIPIHSENGTTHYLIIGLGVASVNESKPAAAVVSSLQNVGLTLSDRPGVRFGVGYTSSFVTTVPDQAEDVRIEASKLPFGPIKIEVQKTLLETKALPNTQP